MIKRIALAILVSLWVLPVGAQDRAADEFRKLQGTWVVLGGEHNGKPLEGIQGGALTFKDQAFALRTASGRDYTGEVKIDASTSPRQIDLLHSDGTLWEAIYTVDGDAFKLNYVEAGGKDKRPTLFSTSSETEASIVVLRRK